MAIKAIEIKAAEVKVDDWLSTTTGYRSGWQVKGPITRQKEKVEARCLPPSLSEPGYQVAWNTDDTITVWREVK